MCGITGIYGVEPDQDKRMITLRKMISTLKHRGPDAWGYYISPEIALAQARLSIVDLKSGDQPMYSDDHVIVYNGEVYNYPELRAELEKKGVSFRTSSDTEVVLKSWEYWGEECFARFNGQFAVIIWNRKKHELLLARDRFGIRPLYILDFNNRKYFASEVKAFDRIPGYSRQFSMKRLYDHCLLWNTYGDHTVYEGISSLPAGRMRLYKEGKLVREKKYYELGADPGPSFNNFREAEDAFKSMMDDAVKLRLRSDVPVGAYLSGGIDSSVILHLINNHSRKSFKTFSVGFEDKEFDETAYQKEMVRHINSEHHSLEVNYESLDRNFPEAVYHFERPVFRTAPVPLFMLSKLVREKDIKVVLTGEGADEILWGYDSFRELKMLNFWSLYPSSDLRPLLIRKLYPHLNHYKDGKMYGMMRMFYEDFLNVFDNELASLNIRIHNNSIMQNYFSKEHALKYDRDRLLEEMRAFFPENYHSFSLLQKNQFLEMRTLLSGYLLSSQGDRMSLAHSVEGRYPFLDHRLVDMLFYMNEDYKLKGFDQKYLLKNAYRKNIPQSIINRPKRPYMSPDLRSFVRDGKLTDNASFFLDEGLVKDYGIFNPKWVNRFVYKFSKGLPQNIGYRDNMIVTFILSTQIAAYWMKNPREEFLDDNKLKVEINDYKKIKHEF